MRKLLVFLVMIGLLQGAAQAEEMVTVDVNVAEGTLNGSANRSTAAPKGWFFSG